MPLKQPARQQRQGEDLAEPLIAAARQQEASNGGAPTGGGGGAASRTVRCSRCGWLPFKRHLHTCTLNPIGLLVRRSPCSVVLPTPFRDAALQAGGPALAAASQPLPAKRAGGVLRDKHGEGPTSFQEPDMLVPECASCSFELVNRGGTAALRQRRDSRTSTPGTRSAPWHSPAPQLPPPSLTASPLHCSTTRPSRPVPHAVRPARPHHRAGQPGRRAGALQRADAAGAVQGAALCCRLPHMFLLCSCCDPIETTAHAPSLLPAPSLAPSSVP